MSWIVCATRGGEGSRVVQREAIRRAKMEGKPLVFVYVIDTSRMGDLERKLMKAVQAELTWLGKALVNIARQRARTEAIEAKVVVLEGNFKAEICRFIKEFNASLLLLGATRETTTLIFGDDPIEKFAIAVEKETGTPVQIVRPELPDSETDYQLLSSGDHPSYNEIDDPQFGDSG